jgi:hypothetical protein
MHVAAYRATATYVSRYKLNRKGARVLEIGSYDVNGTVRGLFDRCDYLGIDTRMGPGVDIVADGSTYEDDQPFAVVVTTETLEHAEDPAGIICNAYTLLADGGWLLITAAAPGRGAHSIDGTAPRADEPYQNIDPDDLCGWLLTAGFTVVDISHNADERDVYAAAQKEPA